MFSLPSHVFALYFPKHQFLLQLFRPRLVHAKPQAIEMTTLQRHPVQRPQELVQIVDRDNRCIGTAPRADVRRKNLIHRCSFTMVFKGEGELYVQKRVAFKETYPSHYDPAPGGVVGAGESYEENAVRELEEEMGIRAGRLATHFDFYHADSVSRIWGRLFSCQWAGDEIKLDPEEVESGSFMSLADVAELLQTGPVCPDSKAAVERYLHATSAVER